MLNNLYRLYTDNWFLCLCIFLFSQIPNFLLYSFTMNVRDHGVSLRSEECCIQMLYPRKILPGGVKNYNVGGSLDIQVHSGPPKCINIVAKIIINKSLVKRWQSVRKPSRKRLVKSIKHKSTVHHHLSNSLRATPYKCPKIPGVADRIKENRLLFSQAREE